MSAAQALPTLQSVLLRPDVWRGDRFAWSGEGLGSGFFALDAELPGNGWPRGALTEVLLDATGSGFGGVGEVSLLRPALSACAADAPVAVVAPPLLPHAPAWADTVPLERLLLVCAQGEEVAWAAEHLLSCGALGALLAWLPAQADTRSLRRLQLAAEGHGAPAFIFRPASVARTASPAPLRLLLTGSAQGLAVRILKRRGPPCAQTLHLAVARPLATELAQMRLRARRGMAVTATAAELSWA